MEIVRPVVLALGAAALLLACGGTTSSPPGSSDPPGTPAPSPTVPSPNPVPGDQCYDCGPCGLAGGPNQADAIHGPDEVGTFATGEAALALTLVKKGACVNEGAAHYQLTFADGKATLAVRDDKQKITTSTAKYANEEYVWNDRELRMTITRMLVAPMMRITFTDANGGHDVACNIVSGAITCE